MSRPADPLCPAHVEANAAHWEALAVRAEEMAAWERDRGIDLSAPGASPGDHKARTYRATATAIRLEASTGKPHCVCCLRPFGATGRQP